MLYVQEIRCVVNSCSLLIHVATEQPKLYSKKTERQVGKKLSKKPPSDESTQRDLECRISQVQQSGCILSQLHRRSGRRSLYIYIYIRSRWHITISAETRTLSMSRRKNTVLALVAWIMLLALFITTATASLRKSVRNILFTRLID
jgi:hypothetical protein